VDGIFQDEKTNEWFFKEGLYIISETDERGIITYVNDVFCEIAGYEVEELLHQPHNIVRHPDMPRTAFKMLWSSIQTKGYWSGIVKNRRKDGGYYWVYATVIRRYDAQGRPFYLSLRTPASRVEVSEAEKLYMTLD